MARDPKYDILFEPIRIGPKTSRNRFYQVPHCNGSNSDYPGEQGGFRGMKAEGGWGVVCTEAICISPEVDATPAPLVSIYDDGDVLNLRHIVDCIHQWGSLAGTEFMHGGVAANNLTTRAISTSPSQQTSPWTLCTYTREADEEDIAELQNQYVEATKRALQAGFDIVYCYGSHSVLPMQFLSPFYNKRTDKYGGSFENRARFWIETMEKMRKVIDGDAALVVRLACDQMMGPAGVQATEDSVRFAELATREGLDDLWDLNVSDFQEWGEDAGSSRFYKANHQKGFTRHVRRVVKAPVVNVGRITSPDDMVEIIKSGQADMIGGARPSIADPYLPKKIEEGRLDDVRECIGCNICVSRWERGARLVCTQNATSMEEYRRGWHPEKFEKTKEPCSVLVVGAGLTGMECARVLGMRGYDVHLVEAEKEIGGQAREIMRYPGLAEWGRLITYRDIQLKKLKNVEIHTGRRLSADDVLKYGAEKIVVCTGARWVGDGNSMVTNEALPGVDASKAQFVTPEQIMAGKEVGERVVVLDAEGYYTGVGMAEIMADRGKQVSIVTLYAHTAPMMEYTLEGPNMHRLLHEKGIKQITSSWAEECEPGNVIKVKVYNLYRDGYQRTTDPVGGQLPRRAGTEVQTLEADTVILVTGRHSNDGLYRGLKARTGEWKKEGIQAVYAAGDCVAPRFMSEAIFEGHRIAREFESPNPMKPLPYIRERTIWGQETMPRLSA